MGAKFPKVDSARAKLLARVHVAKKALGLDEETYRAMLQNSWGVQSSGDLPHVRLADLVNTLEREAGTGQYASNRGYPGRPKNMGPMAPRRARREARTTSTRAAQLQKIEALLTEAGRSWAYADGIARNICKVEAVAWVADGDLYKIIAALVKDAQRHGRRTR